MPSSKFPFSSTPETGCTLPDARTDKHSFAGSAGFSGRLVGLPQSTGGQTTFK